jgi:hypothetical protein
VIFSRKLPLSRSTISLASALAIIAAALAFGAIARAADYQDAKHNVCEGTFTSPGCSGWGGHVKGEANVGLGDAMMPSLTTGSRDFGFGFEALKAVTTGGENIALGTAALAADSEGSGNLAIGTTALMHNTTGCCNTAIQADALIGNTTGFENLALGSSSLGANTTGSLNVAVGDATLDMNTTGEKNVALGDTAGSHLGTGSENVDIANVGGEDSAAESHTIRIGTEHEGVRTFIAGIWKRKVKGPVCTVKVNAAGKLGCVKSETEEPPALRAMQAKVNRQQREIDQLTRELAALRRR